VIISCPNCSARYRLAATVIPDNARMRCAACDHHWTVEAEDEVLPVPSPPVAAPESEPPAIVEKVAAEAPDHAESALDDDAAPEHSPLLRTIAAVVVGGALMIAAAGLWVARIDPAQLPVIGDQLAALAPRPLPLAVTFTAKITVLPSGDRLLEINGNVQNTGKAVVTLPALEARLAGPGGTVRRWRIMAPVASLDAGAKVAFSSTATGFPADATLVGIRPAR
jgi:predicted Zn finger-like uncharacterized protein